MVQQGPPDTLTAEELVQHFANRPAPEKTVDLPESMHLAGEPYKKITIVIPPDSADRSANFEALAHVRKRLKASYGREVTSDDLVPPVVERLIGDRMAKEMLARVLFAPMTAGTIGDTEKPIRKRIFMGADQIEAQLHPDEIAILYDQFLTVRSEIGPRPQVLTRDKELLQLWIDRLKKGAWSLGPLAWLALEDARELCCSALQLIATYQGLGLPLLSDTFMESLRGLVSTQASSDSDSTSSIELAESSVPSTDDSLDVPSDKNITVEQAYELAKRLRRP